MMPTLMLSSSTLSKDLALTNNRFAAPFNNCISRRRCSRSVRAGSVGSAAGSRIAPHCSEVDATKKLHPSVHLPNIELCLKQILYMHACISRFQFGIAHIISIRSASNSKHISTQGGCESHKITNNETRPQKHTPPPPTTN